jgi:uncharacterized protein YjbI with pentapeptide repeats/DNA-binding NarL/FixJ family response regulator
MRHATGFRDADWKAVRLLVYGQDDQFRFLVRQTFRKVNVRDVTTYAEPAETAQMMERGFSLVLVDLGIGAEGGLAVIEQLRKPKGPQHEAVPVLVVAPGSLKAEIDRAKALGIEGVIPKPVSGHELSHRVADTLANPVRVAPPAKPAAPKPNFLKPVAPAEPEAPPPKAAEPVTAAAPPPPSPPAPAPAKPMPASRPASAGGGIGGADRPAKRPSGGSWDDEDLAPLAKRPAGGKLDESDLAGTRPDPDAAARRKAAEKRRKAWADELEGKGHQTREGKDTAGLDVSSVVAEHMKWLETKGAEGKRASFTGMDLAGAELSGAILANANFREVDLSDAGLAEARLDGSDFRYATLSAADLAGANLGVASLRHAKLDLANLEGAILRGTDLSGARFAKAKLAGADMKGAMLVGADLSQADLSRVENLTQAQVEKTLCDTSTRLPPGLNRPPRPEA